MNGNERSPELDEEAFRLIRALVHSGKITEGRLDGTLGSSCLSATRFMALRCIGQAEEPLSLGQLAEQMAFVKSNVTQLIDRLEAEHLVRRIHHPEDRRCILVELTDDGRRQYNEGQQTIQPLGSDLTKIYSVGERRLLVELLERLSVTWK